MSEIKLNLNIILPGSVMYSEQECSKNPQLYTTNSMFVEERKNNKTKNYRIQFNTRKSKPASLSLNISREAYDYMSSVDSFPYSDMENLPYKKKLLSEWKKLSPKQRLETHFSILCKHHNGVNYTYTVFED